MVCPTERLGQFGDRGAQRLAHPKQAGHRLAAGERSVICCWRSPLRPYGDAYGREKGGRSRKTEPSPPLLRRLRKGEGGAAEWRNSGRSAASRLDLLLGRRPGRHRLQFEVIRAIQSQFEVIRAIVSDDSPHVLREQSTHL